MTDSALEELKSHQVNHQNNEKNSYKSRTVWSKAFFMVSVDHTQSSVKLQTPMKPSHVIQQRACRTVLKLAIHKQEVVRENSVRCHWCHLIKHAWT